MVPLSNIFTSNKHPYRSRRFREIVLHGSWSTVLRRERVSLTPHDIIVSQCWLLLLVFLLFDICTFWEVENLAFFSFLVGALSELHLASVSALS